MYITQYCPVLILHYPAYTGLGLSSIVAVILGTWFLASMYQNTERRNTVWDNLGNWNEHFYDGRLALLLPYISSKLTLLYLIRE